MMGRDRLGKAADGAETRTRRVSLGGRTRLLDTLDLLKSPWRPLLCRREDVVVALSRWEVIPAGNTSGRVASGGWWL